MNTKHTFNKHVFLNSLLLYRLNFKGNMLKLRIIKISLMLLALPINVWGMKRTLNDQEPWQSFGIVNIPLELKLKIAESFITRDRSIFTVSENIKSFLAINKECGNLLKDKIAVGSFIIKISRLFKVPIFKAALAFNTFTASIWFKAYLENNPTCNDQALKYLKSSANETEALFLLRTCSIEALFLRIILPRFVESGNINVVKAFIDLDCDIINRPYNINKPALCIAAGEGDERMVELLLSVPHICVDIVDQSSGNTPLLEAAAKGHREIIRKLLNANADITITNAYKDTALLVALMSSTCSYELIEFIVNHSVDIHEQNADGFTAFSYVTNEIEKSTNILNDFETLIDPSVADKSYIAYEQAKLALNTKIITLLKNHSA